MIDGIALVITLGSKLPTIFYIMCNFKVRRTKGVPTHNFFSSRFSYNLTPIKRAIGVGFLPVTPMHSCTVPTTGMSIRHRKPLQAICKTKVKLKSLYGRGHGLIKLPTLFSIKATTSKERYTCWQRTRRKRKIPLKCIGRIKWKWNNKSLSTSTSTHYGWQCDGSMIVMDTLLCNN